MNQIRVIETTKTTKTTEYTDPLMTIGAYAEAVGLSPSALRYYDQIGLLHPDHVDAHNGYRYYATPTVRRARRIRDLREVDVPLDVLRRVLDGDPELAAAELDELATDRERAGLQAAAALRRTARALREVPSTATEPVRLNGPVLADALRAAGSMAAPDEPFDRVLVDLDGDHVDVVATDRFRMFTHRIPVPPGHGGHGRLGIPLSRLADASDWLDGVDHVVIIAEDGELRLTDDDHDTDDHDDTDHDHLPVDPADISGFPDHTQFLSAYASRDHRLLLTRGAVLTALATDDEFIGLAIDAGGATLAGARVPGRVLGAEPGTELRFTTALLREAVTAMPGDQLLVLFGDTVRPVLLQAPAAPGRNVVIMPARPETADSVPVDAHR
ncbi:MerR family transcriptional regulator [Propionibacteriaceae bacterium Y2011]|uniref:MerR family transcriptional regulator n=1 Tax=Microlunatus sp. Y2014 TaxID=3418488 RepID=UPI003B45F386